MAETLKATIDMDTGTAIRNIKNYTAAVKEANEKTGKATEDGRKAGDAADRHADKQKRLGDQARKTGGMFDTAAGQIVAYISGFAGITGVITVIRRLETAMQDVLDIQQQMTDQSLAAGQQVAQLQAQMRWHGAAGEQRALQAAGQVSAAGGLPLAAGADILAALASNMPWAAAGGQFTPAGMETAQYMAAWGQQYAVGPEQLGDLAQLLTASGAETPGEVSARLQQMYAAFLKSPSRDLGEFLQGMVTGGLAEMARGAQPEAAYARFAGFRAVTPTAMAAGELQRQVGRLAGGTTGGKEVRQLLNENAQRMFGRGVIELDVTSQYENLQDLILRAQDDIAVREALVEALPGRAYEQATRYFGGMGLETTARAAAEIAVAEPLPAVDIERDIGGMRRVQRARANVRREIRRYAVGADVFATQELIRQGEELEEEKRAAGEYAPGYLIATGKNRRAYLQTIRLFQDQIEEEIRTTGDPARGSYLIDLLGKTQEFGREMRWQRVTNIPGLMSRGFPQLTEQFEMIQQGRFSDLPVDSRQMLIPITEGIPGGPTIINNFGMHVHNGATAHPTSESSVLKN